MSIVSSDINKAAELLNNGNVVAIPTETVYGLAGNIYNDKAIREIFSVKQRPLYNPLIAHVDTIEKVDEIVREFPNMARRLAEAFWPGPLTLVLRKNKIVPDLVSAGKDTVAVRIPNHPVTLALLKLLDFPLAAPSANPFSHISPTRSAHVQEYFGSKIPMVLEGGECTNGIESTIIGFENDEAVIYRLGSISVEDIKAVIGEVKVSNKEEKAPTAPGMLGKHYAPRTKTYHVSNITEFLERFPNQRIGVLRFRDDMDLSHISHLEVLSKSGNLKEAASKLYSTLHRLDRMDLDIIIAEVFPDSGLGKSINDRLERAAKRD